MVETSSPEAGDEQADQEAYVRPDALETLTLLATPRAAAVLRHRADLGLVATSDRAPTPSAGGLVFLATPADDLDAAPCDAVAIGVLEEPLAGPGDDRFADYVFPTATRQEIAFRASLRMDRGRIPVRLVAGGLDLEGSSVPLSALEQRIVERLIERPGAAVSRADLERVIAGSDRGAPVEGRALDAHIYRLRRKLRDVTGVRIETLRQRGFALSLESTGP